MYKFKTRVKIMDIYCDITVTSYPFGNHIADVNKMIMARLAHLWQVSPDGERVKMYTTPPLDKT